MPSYDTDKWYQCCWCGWWGYFGQHVPGKFLLHEINSMTPSLLLCKRCFEAEDWRECTRIHFRYCCGVKGFEPLDWFQCTKCGKWGYIVTDEPDEYLKFVVDPAHGFDLLCKNCAEPPSEECPISEPLVKARPAMRAPA